MYKIISDEEYIKYRIDKSVEMSEWWNNLKFEDQQLIFEHYKYILKQRECPHYNKNSIGDFNCPDCNLYYKK